MAREWPEKLVSMDHKTFLKSDIDEVSDRLSSVANQLAGKTIVFSGAGGFLGSHFMALFDHLNRSALKTPVRVIALDNFISSACGPEELTGLKGVEFRRHNIIEPFTIEEPVDFVMHAAGIASPVWYQTNPLETLDVSTVGTRNMLELARLHSSRFLYFSTSEIYGDPDQRHVPTSENYYGHVSCRGPRACYDEGKRVGETLCDIYHNYFGLQTVIVRPFNVYGPGLRERDYRVLPNFASRIKSGEPLLVYGSGNQTRTFCYVTDALVGFMFVLLRGVPGEPYNIGNPHPELTIGDLARRICELVGSGASFRIVDYPDGYPSNEPQRRCPDIRKAELHLEFRPQVSLDDGLRRFFSWTNRVYRGLDEAAK
jgi:UDP-glucuronate decarboxylase